jgi:hypothetical protein
MDWATLIAVTTVVAGIFSTVLVGVATYDLRRHLRRGLDENSSRQAAASRLLTEEHRAALARIEELQRSQRKMAAEIADLYDRVTEGKAGAGQEGGKERFLH